MKIKVTSPVIPLITETTNKNEIEDLGFFRWFGSRVSEALQKAESQIPDITAAEEIRLRVNQPLMIRTSTRDFFIASNGQKSQKPNALLITKEDLLEALERMTYSSIYAAEEDLRQGFVTLPGGHRVGITGETVVEHGKIRTLRNVSGLNLRLARQTQVDITSLLKMLLNEQRQFCNTLIISPPRAGKTTIVRLLVKSLSEGVPGIGYSGQNVSVVDERSEIAGMWQGKPAFDLGCRTDVLDRCPKAQGVGILIRSMSPDIVAVDELGSPEDMTALADAVRSGVKILATAHAGCLEELYQRACLKELMIQETFGRLVVLSRAKGPGTIEKVYDVSAGKELTRLKI